ncbi:MAG: DUF1648 domain-containing protein [Ruminiclostridium sp.]|nr:DUF1648 domain-containing protein [Ruminiclostridium sp.]
MKAYRYIHIIANTLAFGVLAAYFIYAMIVWNDIPETIGVHFDSGSGEAIADFDIYGSKWFALFPFVAGLGVLGIFSLGGHIANKVKLGMTVDEKGDKMTRAAVNLYLDALKVGWGVAFAHWADCVIHQHGMFTIVPIIGVAILFFGLIVLSVSLFVIRLNRSKRLHDEVSSEQHIGRRALVKDNLVYRISHITVNVAAFSSLGGYLAFMLVVWWNLPDMIGIHFGPGGSGLFGYADFDVFGDKLFAFYPFWAGFGLLLLFSLLQLAVKKIRLGMKINETGESMLRAYVMLYLDLHKLVWAAFFSHWADCVIHQSRLFTAVPVIGTIILAVGTLVLAGCLIGFRIRFKADKAEENSVEPVSAEIAGSAGEQGE